MHGNTTSETIQWFRFAALSYYFHLLRINFVFRFLLAFATNTVQHFCKPTDAEIKFNNSGTREQIKQWHEYKYKI
jgi:hypothetical protein